MVGPLRTQLLKMLKSQIFAFLVEEKKNLIQSFCHITECLILEKKNCALRDQKKKILTLVLSEKKILNETKNHNPTSLQVKWSVPKLRTYLDSGGFLLDIVWVHMFTIHARFGRG
jgi:hypothetical protein